MLLLARPYADTVHHASQSQSDPCGQLIVLAELGIDYDSSIFPVHNWRYGIPGFPLHPIPIGSGQRVWEFPISVRRLGRVNMPASGGAYFRIYPYWLTVNNFRAAEAAGHGVVFYVHNWELNPTIHVFLFIGKLGRRTISICATLSRDCNAFFLSSGLCRLESFVTYTRGSMTSNRPGPNSSAFASRHGEWWVGTASAYSM